MPEPNTLGLPPTFREHLDEDDVRRNSTLQSFAALEPQLERLYENRDNIDVIVDVGCGGGGFVRALGAYLDAGTIYGIEPDDELRAMASDRGIETFDVDVENESLPFEDGTVDLVLAFGLVEHLRYYDPLFESTREVIEHGWFWIAAPNLASWVNRFALLTGHQPRNVEVSHNQAVGTLPIYDADSFLDHVHAPTYKALCELLETYKFEPVETVALSPYQRNRLARLLDGLFHLRVSWARRVAILAEKR